MDPIHVLKAADNDLSRDFNQSLERALATRNSSAVMFWYGATTAWLLNRTFAVGREMRANTSPVTMANPIKSGKRLNGHHNVGGHSDGHDIAVPNGRKVSTLKKKSRQNGGSAAPGTVLIMRIGAAGQIGQCKYCVGDQIRANAEQQESPPRHGQQEVIGAQGCQQTQTRRCTLKLPSRFSRRC